MINKEERIVIRITKEEEVESREKYNNILVLSSAKLDYLLLIT